MVAPGSVGHSSCMYLPGHLVDLSLLSASILLVFAYPSPTRPAKFNSTPHMLVLPKRNLAKGFCLAIDKRKGSWRLDINRSQAMS